MTNKVISLFLTLFILFVAGVACNDPAIAPEVQTPIPATETESIEDTPEPEETPTLYVLPTQVGTATPFVYDGMNCYSEDLPYAYAESSAVVGWKYFAEREQLSYRVVYFPDTCSQEDIEQDIEHLFFSRGASGETTFLLLDEITYGGLGILYSHLYNYDFWAMGPEDYPMVMETNRYVNPNIIVFRVDRLNGEGGEGNEILGLMVGMGEHEYIHTVQARNNPNLADMIWSDGVYRATIERYANLNNNSGGRYYMASYSYLSLIQMVDGLNEMGELESAVTTILGEMGFTLDEYYAQTFLSYDSHIEGLLISVAGQNYMTHLTKEKLNALLLVKRAGLGDITSYDLVRTLYNRYAADYNLWYYGGNSDQYLPETYDFLFNPN